MMLTRHLLVGGDPGAGDRVARPRPKDPPEPASAEPSATATPTPDADRPVPSETWSATSRPSPRGGPAPVNDVEPSKPPLRHGVLDSPEIRGATASVIVTGEGSWSGAAGRGAQGQVFTPTSSTDDREHREDHHDRRRSCAWWTRAGSVWTTRRPTTSRPSSPPSTSTTPGSGTCWGCAAASASRTGTGSCRPRASACGGCCPGCRPRTRRPGRPRSTPTSTS